MSEMFLDGFAGVLKKTKRFNLHPIGVFHLRMRKAKKNHRNVATGEIETLARRSYVHFSASKWLRALIK